MHANRRIGWTVAALLMATIGGVDGREPSRRKPPPDPMVNKLDLIAVKPVVNGRFWYGGTQWWAYKIEEGRAVIITAPDGARPEFGAVLPDERTRPFHCQGPYLEIPSKHKARMVWIGYLADSVYEDSPSIIVTVKIKKGPSAWWPLTFHKQVSSS